MSSLSAAKPTQKGPFGMAATYARMSSVGFNLSSIASVDFLSLRLAAATGV